MNFLIFYAVCGVVFSIQNGFLDCSSIDYCDIENFSGIHRGLLFQSFFLKKTVLGAVEVS